MKNIKSDCAMWYPEYILGKKWSMLILLELVNVDQFEENSMAYTDITDRIKDISSRTLTRRLDELQKMKLISVHENPETPKKVRYSLTEAGKDLIPILAATRRWSLKHGNCDNQKCINDNCRHVNSVRSFIEKEDIEMFCEIEH